jgi:hypothetical protein
VQIHSGQGLNPHDWGTLQVLERQEQEGRRETSEEEDKETRRGDEDKCKAYLRASLSTAS